MIIKTYIFWTNMRIVISTFLMFMLLGCSTSNENKQASTNATSNTVDEQGFETTDVDGLLFKSGKFYKDCSYFENKECVSTDEEIVTLPSYGYLDAGDIVLTIRGFIYNSNANFVTRLAFVSLLESQVDVSVTEPTDLNSRIDPFLSSRIEAEQIMIQIGTHYYELNASTSSGNFSTKIKISRSKYNELLSAQGSSNTIKYRIVLTAEDTREIEGVVSVITPQGTVVISDIDDTVKVSGVYISKSKVLENTFFKKPQVIQNMQTLLHTIKDENSETTFHYVSGSPKQLATQLVRFFDDNNFEISSLYLRDFALSLRATELYDFFDANSTRIHKRTSITTLFEDFPDSKFILIGDTGEKDPEVYGEFLKKYSQKIETIYLRNVTDENATNLRMKQAFGAYVGQVKFILP